MIWTVAVDAPLGALSYLIPETFDPTKVTRGASVLVPLGGRKVHGVLLGKNENPPDGVKLKAAYELIEDRPPLPSIYVEWLEWMSRYYVYPLGPTMELAFPPLTKAKPKKDGTLKKPRKAPVMESINAVAATREDHSVNLTSAQTAVVDAICGSPESAGEFGVHLLFGVTGSGKTEVYMELIARTIARGEQALVLVPEIALTPQLIERFARRFGDQIAVIHSHLTPREKTDNWWAAREGKKPVLIGARSALFCPLENLGLIVIDEEHESSFKQDETLRYHARDAAVMLAKLRKHPIVLGSATPSLETWLNATSGRYQLHRLPSRIHGVEMPEVEVVDLRESRDADRQSGREVVRPGEIHAKNLTTRSESAVARPFWLSKELLASLTETLDRGEQAALFLNRRGIAQSVVCPSCGDSPQCPNCEVALTLHGRSDLVCHYCDFHETKKEVCIACHHGEPKPLGLGTERIEQDLAKLFPTARLVRMDRDEIQNREDLEDAISKIEKREVDILIGTQMIAKGLDFPGLTLVGLVMADIAFNLPDFRASERAFQLLTQVAGRAGRHLKDGRRGRVILQTYNPDHPSIQFTLAHDFEGFANHDLKFREMLDYPPHGRLAALKFAGPDLAVVERAAQNVVKIARKMAEANPAAGISILGPAPAPLAKLRNLFRYQVLIKGATAQAPVSSFCRTLDEHLHALAKSPKNPLPPKVKLALDIDALHLL